MDVRTLKPEELSLDLERAINDVRRTLVKLEVRYNKNPDCTRIFIDDRLVFEIKSWIYDTLVRKLLEDAYEELKGTYIEYLRNVLDKYGIRVVDIVSEYVDRKEGKSSFTYVMIKFYVEGVEFSTYKTGSVLFDGRTISVEICVGEYRKDRSVELYSAYVTKSFADDLEKDITDVKRILDTLCTTVKDEIKNVGTMKNLEVRKELNAHGYIYKVRDVSVVFEYVDEGMSVRVCRGGTVEQEYKMDVFKGILLRESFEKFVEYLEITSDIVKSLSS